MWEKRFRKNDFFTCSTFRENKKKDFRNCI